MKLLPLILWIALNHFSVTAQNCKCREELDFVINYYENNLPGFSDNVNTVNRESYEAFKTDLRNQAPTVCNKENECYKIILTYAEFFKDNHSSVYSAKPSVNEKDSAAVNAFLRSETFTEREKLDLSGKKFKNKLGNIENIYRSDDGVYTVAIVKSPNSFRDYAGVIVSSQTPLWQKGQVKFELKHKQGNQYDMYMYMRNHSITYSKNISLKEGILNDSWFNVRLKKPVSRNTNVPWQLECRELDPETVYIRIPTFSADWYAKLDTFYRKYDSLIVSRPNLIIDVRNNGGGSDACVWPLVKYIYTKPFRNDNVDVYVTPENIRKSVAWYEEHKNDTVNFDKAYFNEVLAEIEVMKNAPAQSFIPRSQGEWVTLETAQEVPRKVAVITNKHCASSCETLLFIARESDKTIIVGENSGGYVGYGEVSGISTPNFNFNLVCTMTRYDRQRSWEVIGISPDHYLNNDSDWIGQTLKILKQQ